MENDPSLDNDERTVRSGEAHDEEKDASRGLQQSGVSRIVGNTEQERILTVLLKVVNSCVLTLLA